MVAVLYFVDRVAERARGAFSYRIRDLLDRCPIGIDPRFFTELEHCFEVIGAVTRMRTNATIVVDCDPLTDIVFAFIERSIRLLLVREADLAMGSIAKRLVARTAAAAQSDPGDSGVRVTIFILEVGNGPWRWIVQ